MGLWGYITPRLMHSRLRLFPAVGARCQSECGDLLLSGLCQVDGFDTDSCSCPFISCGFRYSNPGKNQDSVDTGASYLLLALSNSR